MLKGIYISNHNLDDVSSGVTKKINMQISALQNLGLDIKAPNFFNNTLKDKILRRIPFVKSNFDKEVIRYIKQELQYGLDFVYVRHSICNIYLIKLFRYLKKNNIPIIYEIPTYPYDRNGFGIDWKILLMKDKFSRKKIYKYIDRGVNFSNYDEIFGVKCIKIGNGINPNMIVPKKYKENEENTITFIGVALLAYWNGYDRLIRAISNYYNGNPKYKITFNIVGDGKSYKELKELSESLGLEDKIIFHGFLSGEKLDELYDKSDIGVGTLASFRKYQNHMMSTLKTKEYTAKGIPFIKCDPDLSFDEKDVSFCLNVSRNEEDLILEDILEWYRLLCQRYNGNKIEMGKDIRKFAFDELTWEKQLLPVVDYIKSMNNK